MPLNRPPLALGQGARGVQDARRWVADLCEEIGRAELVECAQLGVSELVTNALLHGEPPIAVRIRGTSEHPRVEVRDSSVEAPILPTEPLDKPETDDLLLTFGRGLSIVARCSDAWGAEIEDDGKVVWFAPAAEFADGDGIPGTITGDRPPPLRAAPTRDRVRVHILDVPLALYVGFQHHFRELRREVRLLALAHESDYPLAKSLSDLFGSLDRQLRDGIGVEQIEAALAEGEETTDLVVHMPRATAPDPVPLHRAARPRRRVLPRGAAALAGPERRAAEVPGVVPPRVRAAGQRRVADVVARGPLQRPRQRRHLDVS